jgi:hypothetical protein
MSSPKFTPNVGDMMIRDVTLAGAALTIADTTAWRKLLFPQACLIQAFSCVARAKGGTHVTTNFVLKNGSDVIGTIAFGATAAGTRAEATIVAAFARVEAGTQLTIDIVEDGGTTPTVTDLDLQIEYMHTF